MSQHNPSISKHTRLLLRHKHSPRYEPTEKKSLCIFSKQKQLLSWKLSSFKAKSRLRKASWLWKKTTRRHYGVLRKPARNQLTRPADTVTKPASHSDTCPFWTQPWHSVVWWHVRTIWHWFSTWHKEGNMLPACQLQDGKAAPQMQTLQGGGSMWPHKRMGKNTKNGFTELVASNLPVCKLVLKSATSFIAMLEVVKVHTPRGSSFWCISWAAAAPGQSLSREWSYLHRNQLTHVKVIMLCSDE